MYTQEWLDLMNECANCKKCGLASSRTNVVIGRGCLTAPVLIIGEGPGQQEDEQGLPFVGAAGKLLDSLLDALSFEAEDYYIDNIVKCRPPENRVPTDDEAEACLPLLRSQVRLIQPKIIVCLGATALKYIIDREAKITQVRGRWYEKKGFWMMPAFHPAALLRDPSKKQLLWQDFKKVKQKLASILISF